MADPVKNIATGAAVGTVAGGPVGTVVGAAIGAGTSIIQAIFKSRAQDRANKAIQRSLEKASGTLKEEFAKTEKGFSPYTAGGAQAFTDISGKQASGYYDEEFSMDKFNNDPGVEFRLQQANNALERSASAKGRTLSGGTLRSIAELNQSLASQEYGAAYERYRGEREDNFNRGLKLSEFGFRGESELGGLRSKLGAKLADLQVTGGRSDASRNITQGGIYSDLTQQLGSILQRGAKEIDWSKV